MVEDFSTYKWRVNKKEHLDPRDDGLSKNICRHLKVLDPLDEKGIKSLNSLKDDLELTSLHYLSHSRLERVIQRMKTIYPDLELRSNRVNTPVDKQRKTPLDYIQCCRGLQKDKERVQLRPENTGPEKAKREANIQR